MRYYSFEIDGEKVGYYEESDKNGVLYANARMMMGGEVYENPFWLKHTNTVVSAYKYADSDWIDFQQAPDVFPSSAISLLVPSVIAAGEFEYRQFTEGEGTIIGQAVLKLEGDGLIKEYINGDLGRWVKVKDDQIVEYGWGGTAISKYCPNKAQAVLGTHWEDVISAD